MNPVQPLPSNHQRLCDTIAAVFAISPDSIDDTTSPVAVPTWDSLGHLHLVMALEERFAVQLSARDTLEMRDVRRIREVLARHGITC
jgi:acyl carrier protein